MGIESYKASASLNTTLGTIATGEGMARGDVSDAIRQMMADIASGVLPVTTPKAFGAVADGTTDDRAAIQAALTAVSGVGGGVVRMLGKTYLVTKNPAASYAISVPSNVSLEGEAGTIIKLANSADAHVISLSSVSNVTVRNVTIDGNRTNQTGGSNVHGIRIATADNVLIDGVTVKNAFFYGIGLEDGALTDITLDNINLENIGSDGIDIKNIGDLNSNIKLSNISVRNWAISGTGDVAIDCRGPCQLSNITAVGPGSNSAMGIRFRQGELGDVNGLGAHDSTLNGFYVDMGTATSGTGLYAAARTLSITGGRIKGGNLGLYLLDSAIGVDNVRVSGCISDGVTLLAGGSGLDADENVIVNVRSETNGGNGFSIEADQCQLIGCFGRANTGKGIEIKSTSDFCNVIGGMFTGNTAANILDSGTNSRFTSVRGFEKVVNVAGLPTTPYDGQRVYVQDANSATYNAALAGGGATKTWVTYTGAGWKVG